MRAGGFIRPQEAFSSGPRKLLAAACQPLVVFGVAMVLSVAAVEPLFAQTAETGSTQDDATLVLPQVYGPPELMSAPPVGSSGSDSKPCAGNAIDCTPDPLAENESSGAEPGTEASRRAPNFVADVGSLQDYEAEQADAGAGLVGIPPVVGSSVGIVPLSTLPPLTAFPAAPGPMNPLNPSVGFPPYGTFANPWAAPPMNSLTMAPGTGVGGSPFGATSGMMFMPAP